MKLLLKIIAGFFVMVVVVVLGIAVYVDQKFDVIFASPRVTEDDLATSKGAIRLVIDPSHLLPYLDDYFEDLPSVPDWLLPLVTPYEIGVVISADQEEERIGVMAYINARRLGPMILEYANRVAIHTGFTFIEWTPVEMFEKRDGLLVVEGGLAIDPQVRESVWLMWNQSRTLPPLRTVGGHFVELLMDNRSAGAYAAMASFLPYYNIETEELHEEEVVDLISRLKQARLYADFQTKDKVKVRVTLEFRKEDLEEYSLSFKLIADLIVDAIQDQLERRFDVEFSGDTEWNENVLEGEFVLDGFGAILSAVMGAGGAD